MAIRTTIEQREKVHDALSQPNAAWNEVIWTFLVADLIDRSPASAQHVSQLFGGPLLASEPWFESKPTPPRMNEGNSRIDLALGAIRQRGATDSGIEFAASSSPSWVGFVEAKVLSDSSTDVSNDPTRNQITRVIENLLCFQSAGGCPEVRHFSLLTPRYFKDPKHRRSRLYGYKFDEYDRNRQAIVDDIELCERNLAKRNVSGWSYPGAMSERAAALRLHWATYEDILDGESDLRGLDLMQCIRDRTLPDPVKDRLHVLLKEED